MIGYFDDIFNLNVLIRILFAGFVTLTFYALNPFDFYVSLSFSSYTNLFLLCFFTLGFIHLVNITDGLNGLVPTIFLYSCFYYLFKGYGYFDSYTLNLLVLTIISFLIILIPNFYGKFFLGNSGSYSVAILSSFFYMKLYKQGILEYSDILLIYFIPLIDGLRVTSIRIFNKKNPFKGDYLHIHHLIRDKKNFIFGYYVLILFPSFINYFNKDFSILIAILSFLLYLLMLRFLDK